jgi:hypothetical protein
VTQESFDLDLPPVPMKKARHPPDDKVRWSRYRVLAPVHCDDCIMETHQQWPVGTYAPARASWRRVAGPKVTYHCFHHSLAQKARDGVPVGKAKR